MTTIRYFASPILEECISKVERNTEIPLDYTMSMPDDSLICYDVDRKRTIGLLRMYRGIEGIPCISEPTVRDFFKIFDKTIDMEFEIKQDSHHREHYVLHDVPDDFETPDVDTTK